MQSELVVYSSEGHAPFYACYEEGCPIAFGEENAEVFLNAMTKDVHPEVHKGIFFCNIRCRCDLVPRMKVSRTENNFERVFLHCGNRGSQPNDCCRFFQWIDLPPKPKKRNTARTLQKEKPQPENLEDQRPVPGNVRTLQHAKPLPENVSNLQDAKSLFGNVDTLQNAKQSTMESMLLNK